MPRRNSSLYTLVFIIVTGGMGLLAGYGALRLYEDQQAAAGPPAEQAAAQTTSPAGAPPATASKASKSTTTNQPAPSSRASRRSAVPPTLVQSQFPPVQSMADLDTKAPPATASMATPVTSPPAPVDAAPEKPQIFVDLDLTKNKQLQTFEGPAKELRVIGLDGVEINSELKDDTLVIKGPREIIVDVTWENLTNGKRRITLEPTVTNDAGKKLPFTIRNMETAVRQATQVGDQATAALGALKEEQQSIDEYIKSKVRKPPAQDAAARARFDQLKRLIPVAEGKVKALQADYTAAAEMLELAQSLNKNGRILLGDNAPQPATAGDSLPPIGLAK